MKNLKYFFLLFLLIQFSCVKDDTVRDFKVLNEITIEDLGEKHEIQVGGRLIITPTVKTKLNDESGLQYVWYKYNDAQTVADTISYEKNLDVPIFDVLPGVLTKIVLKVTDSKTGIFTRKESTFITQGIYSDGTLILCRNGNEYDLNFLRSKTDALYEDIYSSANDGEKLAAASKMILFTDVDVREPLLFKSVIITSNDNNGGVYLDPTLLQRSAYVREKFMFPDFEGVMNITGYAADQGNDYLIINGKLYPRPNLSNADGDGRWIPSLTLLSEPTDHSLSSGIAQPFGYPFYGTPLVYDNLHNRFMINTKGGYFSFLSNSIVTGGKFDPSNMGSGLEMVTSGCSNATNESNWALMKSSITGDYVVITYGFVYDEEEWTYEFQTREKRVLSRADYPNLYNGALFTKGTNVLVRNMNPFTIKTEGISDIFFFLSNNKVYAFNTTNFSENEIINGADHNYTITGIDCQQMPEPTQANPEANYVRLGIAVKDNALSTKTAGVVFFRLSNLGGLSATKYYAKTGICDEIIDFKEKLD